MKSGKQGLKNEKGFGDLSGAPPSKVYQVPSAEEAE